MSDPNEAAPAPEAGESLRDRKARITREAIHTAAVQMAYAKGLEEATIAQISAEAGISQRTFFNYFASKEDAIIGTAVNGPDERVVTDAVAVADFSDDLFEATARVIREIMSHSLGDDETREMRRVLFTQHPLLVQRKSDTGGQLAALLIDVLVDKLSTRLGALELPDGFGIRDAARMVVLVSFAPLRNTYSMFSDERKRTGDPPDTGDAPSAPDTSPEAARRRFDRSLELFHIVMEGLRS